MYSFQSIQVNIAHVLYFCLVDFGYSCATASLITRFSGGCNHVIDRQEL